MKHAPTRQQEESSTVQSQVGESPVQDTTVQSSNDNIQASSDSIRTISGQTPTLKSSNFTVQDPVVPTVVPSPQASMNVRTVNLLKLKLPIFSGDVLRWAEFSNMFSASVDTQVILSDVQKFTYLKEHLRDAAAERSAACSYRRQTTVLPKTCCTSVLGIFKYK